MKLLRIFLIANLCALVPLWVVTFGWMPDQVKVEARGRESVALVESGTVLQGEEHGTWKEGTVWRFYLRNGMAWKNLAFRLPEGMNGQDVGHIRLEKWKLLSLWKAGAGLERKDVGKNEFAFKSFRFERIGVAQGKIPFGFAGLEAVLIGLSWWGAKRARKESWQTLLPSALGIALALSLLMQVSLPIQSYVANRSAFPFSLGELCGTVTVRFVITVALSGVALGLLARCFGRWTLALALAFVVCAYLESGILSGGEPELNGDWGFFTDRMRAKWDAAVWGGVAVLVAALHPLLKRRYGSAGLCLSGLVLASLFDVKAEERTDNSNFFVHDFSPIETVVRSVAYSTNQNVLMFVVDSLEREQAHAIMEDAEAGPDLKEKFRGFTEYVDNVGAAQGSLWAIPNLFTGKYLEDATGLADYFASVYAPESALQSFLDKDFAIHSATHALGYGWTSEKIGGKERESGARYLSCFEIPSTTGVGWNLSRVVKFRWLPFGCKYLYGIILELCSSQHDDFAREWVLYPLLADAPSRDDGKNMFLFVHTLGVHEPISRNRYGAELSTPEYSYESHTEMGIFVLKELAHLFDVYRSRGIYDNSMIFVLGDHGNRSGGKEKQDVLPGLARPCLWIKPIGSEHPFSTSYLPTTHAHIANVLHEASKQAMTEDDIQKTLMADERRFRKTTDTQFCDWLVAPDGSFREERGYLHCRVPDKWEPLRIGYRYDFAMDRKTAGETRNIEFSNLPIHFGRGFEVQGNLHPYPTWWDWVPTVGISFKVSDFHAYYSVRLELRIWSNEEAHTKGGSAAFSQVGNGKNGILVPFVEGYTAILLNDIVPDEQGVIRLQGDRRDGLKAKIQITSMEISKDNSR